jgi:preprotein translocase subunit SecA
LKNVAEEMLSKSDFIWSESAKAHAQVSIKRWVDSIIMGYVMEEDVNYIISESGSIKPVDFANTGVIQSNTSLSYGTHQFLEVKHFCRMTLETRTTNFISNYSFIKQYKANIVGLTGTIGG